MSTVADGSSKFVDSLLKSMPLSASKILVILLASGSEASVGSLILDDADLIFETNA